MEIYDLLNHVADNLKGGKNASDGLTFDGVKLGVVDVDNILWYCSGRYAVAPSVANINGTEVYVGTRIVPEIGDRLYVPSVSSPNYFSTIVWHGSSTELRSLNRGVLFVEKEGAVAMAKAMLDF